MVSRKDKDRESSEFFIVEHIEKSKRAVSDLTRDKMRERFWDRYPDLVEELTKVHGDRYDYSKVEYVDYGTPITIICKEHGEFKQLFYYHRKGHGCPKCGDELIGSKQTHSQEKVIANFREVHGDKYDYSKVEYVRNNDKVIIICPEHGEFLQSPAMHKRGQGCRACGHKERLKVWTKKKSPNETKSKILALRKQGLKPKQISEKLGIKIDLVYQHRLEGKSPRVKVDQEKVLKLSEEGFSLREIAKRLGTSKSTVTRSLLRSKGTD